MIRGIHHTAISTGDLQRSLAFYCDLLGFEKVFEGGFFNVRSPLRTVSASALNKSAHGPALTPKSAAKSGGGARSASSALKIARVTRVTRASMLNFDEDEN